MRRSISAVPLLLALAGCAAGGGTSRPPPSPAGVTESSTSLVVRMDEASPPVASLVSAPAEELWRLLAEVYDALDLPAEVNDPVGRAFGTRRFSGSRIGARPVTDYVRCGNQGAGPSAAGAHRYRLTVLSTLVPLLPDQTRVSIEVGGSATSVEGTSTGAVRCVSTGELERRIHRMLEERTPR